MGYVASACLVCGWVGIALGVGLGCFTGGLGIVVFLCGLFVCFVCLLKWYGFVISCFVNFWLWLLVGYLLDTVLFAGFGFVFAGLYCLGFWWCDFGVLLVAWWVCCLACWFGLIVLLISLLYSTWCLGLFCMYLLL